MKRLKKKLYESRRLTALLMIMCLMPALLLAGCGSSKESDEELPLKVNNVDELEGKSYRCTAWYNRRHLCI